MCASIFRRYNTRTCHTPSRPLHPPTKSRIYAPSSSLPASFFASAARNISAFLLNSRASFLSSSRALGLSVSSAPGNIVDWFTSSSVRSTS